MHEVKILLIEDSETDYEIFHRTLSKLNGHQFNLNWRKTVSLCEGVQESQVDLVYLDLNLGETNGLDSLAIALNIFPNTPIVVFTTFDYELGIEAINLGACDYIFKDKFNSEKLKESINSCLGRGINLFKLKKLAHGTE